MKENRNYKFRVCANNKAGNGEYSDETDYILAKDPNTVPSAPQLKVDKVSENSVKLTWKVPERDGGCSILGYLIKLLSTVTYTHAEDLLYF